MSAPDALGSTPLLRRQITLPSGKRGFRSKTGRLHAYQCMELTNDGPCACDESGVCAWQEPAHA